jgi:hypothetical protein
MEEAGDRGRVGGIGGAHTAGGHRRRRQPPGAGAGTWLAICL